MPQNPFCWSTRSFICHTGLGEVLPSNRYALAVHFLSAACLRILKYTVIAITTPGNKSENMSCISEELLLKSHMGHGKSKEMGGKGEEHRGYSGGSCSYLVWAGVGSVLVPALLTAVTAAVINPLNGELLCRSQPTADLPAASYTTFRNSCTSLALWFCAMWGINLTYMAWVLELM